MNNKTCKCQRCGLEWTSRLRGNELPRACPSCKSYTWNKKGTEHTCDKCNHTWNSYLPNGKKPKACPKCFNRIKSLATEGEPVTPEVKPEAQAEEQSQTPVREHTRKASWL